LREIVFVSNPQERGGGWNPFPNQFFVSTAERTQHLLFQIKIPDGKCRKSLDFFQRIIEEGLSVVELPAGRDEHIS